MVVKTDRNSCGMASRGFLAAARLSCCPMQWHRRGIVCRVWTFVTQRDQLDDDNARTLLSVLPHAHRSVAFLT